MAKYQKRPDIWNACQWKGHGESFDLDVEVTRMHGVSGYGAKLGYFEDENKRMRTVRPNEYVVVSPKGVITSMNPNEFESDFMLAKSTGSGNNKGSKSPKVSEDNAA